MVSRELARRAENTKGAPFSFLVDGTHPAALTDATAATNAIVEDAEDRAGGNFRRVYIWSAAFTRLWSTPCAPPAAELFELNSRLITTGDAEQPAEEAVHWPGFHLFRKCATANSRGGALCLGEYGHKKLCADPVRMPPPLRIVHHALKASGMLKLAAVVDHQCF
jgi:hypothetical protein